MGQAKRRGTFEQRQAEAIQLEAERRKVQAEELAARKEQQRLYDLAHPEQAILRRARLRHGNALLTIAMGAALAGTGDIS